MEEVAVKISIPTLFAAALLMTAPFAGQAFANNDEDAQIAACVDDNDDSGQTEETLTTYCQCASGKVGNFSTPISAWEKSHADEQEACSKEAGWKY